MSETLKTFLCAVLKVAEIIASKTDNEIDDKIVATLKFLFGCK